jgi:ABC-type multidrug transport system fused ATPase/permease subunit
MHKAVHFWMVTLLSGFFGGLLVFILLFTFNLLINKSFSLIFMIVYLAPLFVLWFSVSWLRDSFGKEVISFRQGFFTAALTGIILTAIMSLAIYYVYSHLNYPALEHRTILLETELMQVGNMEDLSQKKQLVKQLMSPENLALFFTWVNLILLPFYAFFIAIFAKRKNRYLDESL